MDRVIVGIIAFLIGYKISSLTNNRQEIDYLRRENERLRYFLRKTKPKAR